MNEVVLALLAGTRLKQFPDPVPQFADSSFRRLAKESLELGKHHLDRVQVRRIRRRLAPDAPAVSIAVLTPATLCTGRLSMMTISFGR